MKTNRFIFSAAAALLFASCNQKELCYDHWEHAPRYNYVATAQYDPQWQLTYDGGIDWRNNWDTNRFEMTYESLIPGIPSGLRCLVFNTTTHYDTYNLPAEGGRIGVSEGEHSLLFFNNDTEYIVFSDLYSAAEATATTRTRTRSSYYGSPYRSANTEEHTVSPPDMLYGSYVTEFEGVKTTDATYVDVMMKPLVFRYLVRYHFDYGLQYVRLARGAMAGMAGAVYLTDGHTPEEPATVLFDVDVDVATIKANYQQQLAAAENPTDYAPATKIVSQNQQGDAGSGMLYTIVNSFGAPGYPNPFYVRGTGQYGLNLEVRLGNGHVLNYDFDITEQIEKQPRGGVIDVYGIVITDEQGKEGSGAFDINVEDWGDHEDILIFDGKVYEDDDTYDD